MEQWLSDWCLTHLGTAPVGVLFEARQVSTVHGLRLADGRKIVLKARPDDGRADSCVAAQAQLSALDFPCARPLTPVISVGSLAVHAEEYRPGGEVIQGGSPEAATRYAEVFALLLTALGGISVTPPLPNPRWLRWDHRDPGLWPAIGFLDERDQRLVPEEVTETADRARRRLLAAELPNVLGHGDFEAQNLRWDINDGWTVHDWDSLAWQPEAALAGAASGMFASTTPPTLAPVESSAMFLESYQDFRGRRFSPAEQEVAWAASLWPAAHNARWEALHDDPPICGAALREQAPERLRLANA
ncbi:phosphotransferase [Amycolatopsis dendrobii]|uniref:Phosphotransferase n=1 Tax=Amycolatopsis dendrobii TaxID=2760662 RepID=A0A7W3VW47_9PSEU|nr:phosphotransferase [Amycolatopsis dendrobii]MBB1154308.1 phosphotransferase [Amycolatopsis dendrobii]